MLSRPFIAAAGALLLLLSACSRIITPKGEPAERARAAAAEGVYAVPVTKRPLPDLATSATLPKVLEYAFNSNGEIEAAYREWRAALERVPLAGALPNPRLNLNFIFAPVNMKDFMGILGNVFNEIGVMLEQEIPGKGKRPARAKQALAEARAVGERFRAVKFMLQSQLVGAWAALALNEALQEQTRENLRLLKQAHEVVLHRYHLGSEAVLADLRKIEIEIQKMESELRELRIERPRRVAELNKLLNRPADAPVGQAAFPEIQPPRASEAELFARAVRSNPQLAALRREIQARGAAQVLAELEKRPDFMLGAGMMANPMPDGSSGSGGVKTAWMPSLSLSMTLPINRARIRAGIAEALAMRQATEARLRAARSDILARVVIALAMLRDAQRVTTDYNERIIPRTRELLDAQLSTYGAGGGELLDILDTERLLVDFQKLILRAEADRLRASGELEEILGEDLFKVLPTPIKNGR